MYGTAIRYNIPSLIPFDIPASDSTTALHIAHCEKAETEETTTNSIIASNLNNIIQI
ncbi:MAG: hypothetical protein KDD24_00265 [Flavobacteriales bacterium]|nr:hypothetical protein [Flavobacteriales bacterium]